MGEKLRTGLNGSGPQAAPALRRNQIKLRRRTDGPQWRSVMAQINRRLWEQCCNTHTDQVMVKDDGC